MTGLPGLRSGQVAEAAGVNLQTLRYYERRGLLAEPDRTLGGHRVYSPETVTVLRVIKADNLISPAPNCRTARCRSPISLPEMTTGQPGHRKEDRVGRNVRVAGRYAGADPVCRLLCPDTAAMHTASRA